MQRITKEKNMKHVIVLSAITLASGITGVSVRAGEVRVGPVAGVSATTVSVDNTEPGIKFDPAARLAVGVSAEFPLGKELSLVLEPTYMGKGTKLKESGSSDGGGSTDIRLNYVEIPVLMKVGLGGHGARPYLIGGPTLGLRTSAKSVVEGSTEDIKDQVRSTDFGVAFGGGVEIPVGKARVSLEGRYHLGLQNLNVSIDDPEGTAKNRALLFRVGLTFGLGSH
jgi:opacity protein-like surface antigen